MEHFWWYADQYANNLAEEQKVKDIMEMGFSREESQRALDICAGDKQAALDYILSQMWPANNQQPARGQVPHIVRYNETVRQMRDYNKEIREEKQGKSQIPRGTKTQTPRRRQPWN